MASWWEHALDAVVAARKAGALRAAQAVEAREAKSRASARAAAPKKMAFGGTGAGDTSKASCCITQRKLKVPEGGGES